MGEGQPKARSKKSDEKIELELRYERARTEKAEMALKQAQGELIEIEKVKQLLFSIAAATKEKLERLPQNCARKVASLRDPREIEMLLRKEVTSAMLELSRSGQRGYMLAQIEEREMEDGGETMEEEEPAPRELETEEASHEKAEAMPERQPAKKKAKKETRAPERKAEPVKEKLRYDPYLEDDD